MIDDEPPAWLSPYGSLPNDNPQPTPEDLSNEIKRVSRLKGFIDLDEAKELTRDEKVQLVQIICGRFIFGHLSGRNGAIGYSDTLRPEVQDKKTVADYRSIATHLWHQGSSLPYTMKQKDLRLLVSHGVTDDKGYTKYFESIIKPPKVEPSPNNPYLREQSFAYHEPDFWII